MEHNDNLIVRKCLNGDTEVFSSIIDKYQKPIFNVAYRMVHNYDDAEDIAQSVFIKTYENLRSFNPKYKFFSWIYRTAINESINYLNKQSKKETLDEYHHIKGKTVEEYFDNIEISERIDNALQLLEINYRTVIVLKHFMDFSYREMGEILDIPEKTVKSRLFTARQILKDLLIQNKINIQ